MMTATYNNETAFPILHGDAHASSGLIFAHAPMWCHLVDHLSYKSEICKNVDAKLLSRLSLNKSEYK